MVCIHIQHDGGHQEVVSKGDDVIDTLTVNSYLRAKQMVRSDYYYFFTLKHSNEI
jgi:hypothetical protein